jgi:hypothetical protein
VRTIGESRFLNVESLPAPEAVEDVIGETERAAQTALGGMTIKDLAATPPETMRQSEPPAPRAASA